jgi:hypothetical protein
MPDQPETRIVKVPMLDTGLGREAGYRDDAELIAAYNEMRESLSPEGRGVLDVVMSIAARRAVEGSG